ncbi:MAG: aldo/keto reductase, partial [Chloroflexi bacterium]|nr:aldo/keto reductase [Chloroflexota bacterium]
MGNCSRRRSARPWATRVGSSRVRRGQSRATMSRWRRARKTVVWSSRRRLARSIRGDVTNEQRNADDADDAENADTMNLSGLSVCWRLSMKTRTLGRTGLAVSELALGGLFLASWFATPEQSAATVRRAVELGVNYIDTAPGYGNSEEALGHALRALGDAAAPLILSTKLGGRPQPFNPQDKASLRASVEESLRLLGRDQVDLLMIHEPDRPGQYDWWSDWENFTGPALEVLDELKQAG